MAQGSQSGRTWNAESQEYYYYDPLADPLNFQSGRRVPRDIPRTARSSRPSHGLIPSVASYARPTTASNSITASTNSSWLYAGSRSAQPSASVDSIYEDMARIDLKATTLEPQPAVPAHKSCPVPAQVTERNGRRVVYASDPRTGVSTIFQAGPAENITDPALLRSGISASRYIFSADSNPTETLFESFRVRDQPKKFFTVGRVFLVLWVEPMGESVVTNYVPGESLGRFGERVFSKVRRFIVIRQADTYCTCLPIMTYGFQGVAKPGVNKSEHSIVYTSKVPPEPLPGELPKRNEEGMRPQAIRVDTDDPIHKLDRNSRLDYGKVYTMQYSIKVKSFGKVNPKSMNAFVHQFGNVWNSQPVLASQSNVHDKLKNVGSNGQQECSRSQQRRNDSPSRASEEAQTDNVQNYARAAARRLIAQGFSEAQAIDAIRAEWRRKAESSRITKEDDEEGEEGNHQSEEDDDG